MKKLLFLVLSLTMTQLCLADKQKKADAQTNKFRYDIEYARPTGDGMCQVKVWSYSNTKKANVYVDQCRKNAVHGIIFKSYSSGDGTGASQRPLVKDPAVQQQKAEFFAQFFQDAGPYRQFVSAVTDGSQQIVKVGRQYKIGVVVTVSKDQLRKYLESQGIIHSLSSGF